MSNKKLYNFIDPPDVTLPENAVLWTQSLYCDKKGWYSLTDNEKFEPKPTRFEGRLIFLDRVEETDPEIQSKLSGQYDVKTWEKQNCIICIEADKYIYIKLPNINTIINYSNSGRFPEFTRSWKPIYFKINNTTYTIRLTEEITLVILRNDEKSNTFHVSAINYNSGFACAHPLNSYGIAYGGFIVKKLKNCIEIPHIESVKDPWGYTVQFYKWGGLVIPKEIDLKSPSKVVSSITRKNNANKIGIVFCPPNIFLHLKLDVPAKINKKLIHGKDFAVTAKKESESDINIYLLMDGQLVLYNYSFDIRINKAGKSRVNYIVKFKAITEIAEKSKNKPKLVFKGDKSTTTLITSGSPLTDFNFLINEEVIALFDAERMHYLTHPIGMKHCDVFKKLAVPVAE